MPKLGKRRSSKFLSRRLGRTSTRRSANSSPLRQAALNCVHWSRNFWMSTRRCARFSLARQLAGSHLTSAQLCRQTFYPHPQRRTRFIRAHAEGAEPGGTCCNRQSPGSSTGQLFPILHYSWRSDSPPPKGFRLLNPSGFRVHLAAMNRETTFLTPLSNYSEPAVQV